MTTSETNTTMKYTMEKMMTINVAWVEQSKEAPQQDRIKSGTKVPQCQAKAQLDQTTNQAPDQRSKRITNQLTYVMKSFCSEKCSDCRRSLSNMTPANVTWQEGDKFKPGQRENNKDRNGGVQKATLDRHACALQFMWQHCY